MTRDEFADQIKGVVVTLFFVWLLTLMLVLAAAITYRADTVVIVLVLHLACVFWSARIGWLKLKEIYINRLQPAERSGR